MDPNEDFLRAGLEYYYLWLQQQTFLKGHFQNCAWSPHVYSAYIKPMDELIPFYADCGCSLRARAKGYRVRMEPLSFWSPFSGGPHGAESVRPSRCSGGVYALCPLVILTRIISVVKHTQVCISRKAGQYVCVRTESPDSSPLFKPPEGSFELLVT